MMPTSLLRFSPVLPFSIGRKSSLTICQLILVGMLLWWWELEIQQHLSRSKAMKKAETRGTGKTLRVGRKFTAGEVVQAIDLMGNFAGAYSRRNQVMMKFQYHLIGRGDDTSHIKKSHIFLCTPINASVELKSILLSSYKQF